jgi:hypothetical protein
VGIFAVVIAYTVAIDRVLANGIVIAADIGVGDIVSLLPMSILSIG